MNLNLTSFENESVNVEQGDIIVARNKMYIGTIEEATMHYLVIGDRLQANYTLINMRSNFLMSSVRASHPSLLVDAMLKCMKQLEFIEVIKSDEFEVNRK